jgi:CysZ protein
MSIRVQSTVSALPSLPRPNVFVQFFAGACALPRGLRFLARTRTAWPLAAVPMAVCALLCALAIAGSITLIPKLTAAIWPGLETTLGAFGAGVVRVLGITVAALVGLFAATFAAQPLSAPALDRLVLVREHTLGVASRPAAGLWRELRCALQAQLFSLAVFSPVLAVLWTLTWLFPPIAVGTVPLKFLVLSALLAWSLLDYPLSLRGLTLSARLRLLRRGWARVFGFGAALALVFMVPLVSLLLLPAAVVAAAEIAVVLERERL